MGMTSETVNKCVSDRADEEVATRKKEEVPSQEQFLFSSSILQARSVGRISDVTP